MREAVSSVLKKRVVKTAEERSAEILEAALHLFSDKGFHETTVDDIAQGAGVAKGTVYLYFPSKEHILLALKRQFLKGLEARCAEVISDTIEALDRGERPEYKQVINELFDSIIEYNVERREAVEVVVRQTPGPDLVEQSLELESDYLQLMATAFRVATEYGLIHTSDPEMMAYLVNTALRDNIVTCLCYESPADLGRLVAAAKELLYKALAPVDQPAVPSEDTIPR